MNTPAIRLLAPTDNERGDLFTRLTKDLFFALGYDNLRLNVHKAGREVDLVGGHRFEPRRVVGECKAHAGKMGGAELNKFFGALARERSKSSHKPVAGYFVSLSGFTETGIEQEIETGDDRVILLDAQNVVGELERSRVIVGHTEAAERAGHCAQHAGLRDAVLDGAELLGHQRGYLWAVFYARGKERTHVALIYADGTPLAEPIAREVIDADQLCGGSLHSLQYLAPPPPEPDRTALATKAFASYLQWLGEECGYIHLDGLPADTDLSATRLKLERLFVPLKATLKQKPTLPGKRRRSKRRKAISIGDVLEKTSRLALLAMPGGGKSTLLKRLAIAYAFPERRDEISDKLPQRDWLPLILRCRELRDRAHRPIIELLDDIPLHAGMSPDECAIFRESVHAALRAGHALLLVDGLDEISDEGARQTFANHLRTFIAMFPKAALVVTSREAGFRLVAGVVASACDQATLALLEESDVLDLCERWHAEVIGNSSKVRAEAKELGQAIWDNERVRRLAENPLLLTTLLVVKRWVGELPRSRAGLYREAIRVLVRTWNVEGYAPLDEDETLAQLSYVACAMMEEGKQQIGQNALLRLLQDARRELEAELQFARISPQEFIDRIEYRSSLLMQTGHERINGLLEPVYEFRHLTFQEYLAARGYVEEQYPHRDSGQSLADELERHFKDESWREVISLAAVLAGRKAEDTMKRLISSCKRSNLKERRKGPSWREPLSTLLYQCILDEVQITAPTLRAALLELARSRKEQGRQLEHQWVARILRGKFGAIFREVVEQTYLAGGDGIEEYLSTLDGMAIHLYFGDETPTISNNVVESLLHALEAEDRISRIHAALVCMWLAYSGGGKESKLRQNDIKAYFQRLSDSLSKLLDVSDVPCALVSSWALAWIGEQRLLVNPPSPDMILSLYRLWHHLTSKAQARYPAWALGTHQLLPRDTFKNDVWGDCDVFLRQALTEQEHRWIHVRDGALVVNWYRRGPCSDIELVEQISKRAQHYYNELDVTTRELLENLGEAGRLAIENWERKHAKLLDQSKTWESQES